MAEFADQVKAWADKTEKRLDLVPRKVALEVLRRVVLRSPVGNMRNWITKRKGYVGGRFRGNWQVGIGLSPDGVLDRIDPSGSAAINEGMGKINGWKPTAGQESLAIVNNLPYGEALEHGHSRQAPVGMVAITAAEFGGILEEAVR